MNSRQTPLLLFLMVLGLLFAGSALRGEESPAAPQPAQPAPERASADATMRTFLQAFPNPQRGRPDRIVPEAVACIQFSGSLSLLSTGQRREIAIQLKSVIDRIAYVDYEAIARDSAGLASYTFHAGSGGAIVIAREENGEWLFTSGTVDDLPGLLDEVRDRAVVAGVTAMDDRSLGHYIRDRVPESLRTPVFLLESWQWIGLLVIIAAGVVADRLLVLVLELLLARVLKRARLELAREERLAALRPLGLLGMAVVWGFAIGWLMLPATAPTAAAVLNIAVRFLAAVSFVWAAYRGVDGAVAALMKRAERTATKMDDLVIPFVGRIIKIFIVAFGIVFVAQNLGVNITSILAGLGLGGLAFALAAKDTIENLFGSITVLIDQPFRVGDWVNIDGKVDGTVETVGLRSTRIRTFYNSVVTVPNSILIKANVDNYGLRRYRRWSTTLSVTYDTPPEKIDAFCEGIRELILLHPYTRRDYYHVYANEFGASSLNIMLYVFFECPDWGTELRERHRLFTDILRLARRLGVEFAFPTQTLYMRREEPAHPDSPPDVPTALATGRGTAREVVRESFGAKVGKPPPVQFNTPRDADADDVRAEHSGGEG